MNHVTQQGGRLARWTAHLPGGRRSLPLALPWAAWCWGVITTAVLACAVLVAVVPGLDRRRRLARHFARGVLALGGVRLGVGDTRVLPANGCIVVANHASYLDGIILTAALPPAFSFVIKKEITRVPVAHFLLRRLGSEFVDRFDARRGASDIRRLFKTAGDARALAVFPEGTFQARPGLMAFRRTAFTLACRADLPVVPVTIRGARRVL
ncbi:MAG: lysophospholipid acyltransferase family protein, partial [Anaerolineae bacterium]